MVKRAAFRSSLRARLDLPSVAGRLERQLGMIRGQVPVGVGRGIVFAACDAGYYWRFGRSLAASVALNAPGVNLHLHLYQADEPIFEDLRRQVSARFGDRLSWTWDLPGASPFGRGGLQYYASARFIYLHRLLTATDGPVLSLDIDSLLMADPFDHVRQADADAGIFLRAGASRTVRKVLASALWLKPSPAARRFSRRLAGSLAETLHLKPHRHFDQSSIWYVWRLEGLPGTLRTARIDQRWSDWECGPESLVWTAKGPRKHAEGAFHVAAERLLQSFESSEFLKSA